MDSNSLLANDPMATEFINHAHFPLSPLSPLLHIMLLWKSCTLTGYIILSFYSFPFTRQNFLCCHVVLIMLVEVYDGSRVDIVGSCTRSLTPSCLLACLSACMTSLVTHSLLYIVTACLPSHPTSSHLMT